MLLTERQAASALPRCHTHSCLINTHLRALLRRLWQAPVAAVPHHLLCGQLYQEHTKTIDVSRQGAPRAHQQLWCCIQAAAALSCARCTAQHLGEAQVSQAGPLVIRKELVAACGDRKNQAGTN